MKLHEISFEIIQKCPNNCIYCSSNSSINSKNIVSLDVFKLTIDDAVNLGLKRLCISGGEPFLHPNILDMVKYAKGYNLEIYIYTSGIMLDKKNELISIEDNYLDELSKLKVDKLIFNIQTFDEELYNEIMGTENCFNILKNSIKKTKERKIYCEAHFVPMKINYGHIDSVIEMVKELGVDKISFLRLVLQGRAKQNKNKTELSIEENKKVMDILKNINIDERELDIRRGIPLSSTDENKVCNAATEKLIIRYDGAVFPCEAFKYINNMEYEITPDNINNMRLKDIYANSKFIKLLRNEICKFNSNNTKCESCPAQWILKKQHIK